MGLQQSVIKIEEAESKACPGVACYTTDSLDELCDYDRLWEELKQGLRMDFAKDETLKSGDTEHISENEFIVNRVHDGEKLKAPVAEVLVKIRYRLDKEKGLVVEEIRNPLLDFVQNVRIIRTLRDPLRLEVASQRLKMEERESGLPMQIHIYALLKGVLKREVNTMASLPSRATALPGLSSAYSEPLEGSPHDLYKSIIETLRTQEHHDLAKDVDATEIKQEKTKASFTVSYTLDGEKVMALGLTKTNEDSRQYLRVEANEESRTICVIVYSGETDRIISSSWTVIHQDPLTVEAWGFNPVGHEADNEPLWRHFTATTLNDYCCMLLKRLEKL